MSFNVSKNNMDHPVKVAKFASTSFLQYREANLMTFTCYKDCNFRFPILYIWKILKKLLWIFIIHKNICTFTACFGFVLRAGHVHLSQNIKKYMALIYTNWTRFDDFITWSYKIVNENSTFQILGTVTIVESTVWRNYRLIFCYETHIWFLNISHNEEIAILNTTTEKEEKKTVLNTSKFKVITFSILHTLRYVLEWILKCQNKNLA